MYAGGKNAQECLYLTVCHMTILRYQFTHDINVLWHNGCFWTTVTQLVFDFASSTIELIKSVWMVFYRQTKILVHQCSVVVIILVESCKKQVKKQ